ncbi:CAP domain-containing protein [Fulvimarina sp. 2208YS6-2-32]|uniref:CAP domain-containing protein n=1 Tax=Fulvimarina uroteuthidis TaxID=3098149 RepID=A0ABU5I4P4_9HYPH|nr:CAP domain-containing protein [Fulvimarina sp. 2208YS6-2-32]MDY8109908.1 CAP domain-containing protein [Fulvimarina sp. 2208YS6-2-32]
MWLTDRIAQLATGTVAVASTATLSAALTICLGYTGSAGAVEPGNLDALREEALAEVNSDRAEYGLPALELQEALNESAQIHAMDMVQNDYYAHVSPEGVGPQDRFLNAGGSLAKLVEENIARCSGCALPPDEKRVQSFESGWMNSPSHRSNILNDGLEGFGFGIAGKEGEIFAVQTFAGPGTSPSLGPDQSTEPVAESKRSRMMVSMLNQARERQDLPPLSNNATLAAAAENILPEDGKGLLTGNGDTDLIAALPADERRSWHTLQVVSAGCGGCGVEITDADLDYFRNQWLNNPQFASTVTNDRLDQAGAAFLSNGEGAKRAVVVFGARR